MEKETKKPRRARTGKAGRRKKPKKVKLEPKARIRRRLMKLWTMAVHAEFGERCAVCGSASKPNAHHIESRIMFKGLRYDPMNGVLLCPTHHKFGKDSAHMAGCWFAQWLARNLPERFEYVIAHHADPDPDLEDRNVLAAIEASLRAHIAKYGEKPKPDGPLDPDELAVAVSQAVPHLADVPEDKLRKAVADCVRNKELTQAEADQMLKEVLAQKNEASGKEKERNEGNADIQG